MLVCFSSFSLPSSSSILLRIFFNSSFFFASSWLKIYFLLLFASLKECTEDGDSSNNLSCFLFSCSGFFGLFFLFKHIMKISTFPPSINDKTSFRIPSIIASLAFLPYPLVYTPANLHFASYSNTEINSTDFSRLRLVPLRVLRYYWKKFKN